MKSLLFVLALICHAFFAFSQTNIIEETKAEYSISSQYNSPKPDQTVYICTGPYSYAYHSTNQCAGLNNCRGEINYTYESYAISLGRKPCCRCWSNVYSNCHEDNSTSSSSSSGTYYGGGGGGGSEALAVVGLIYLCYAAIGTVLISNDMYLHYGYSFEQSPNKYNYKISDRSVLQFGLRKNFKHWSVEYGISEGHYINTDINQYYQQPPRFNQFGFQFNVQRQIFYNKIQKKFKLYVGPAINYNFEFGYGGVIGIDYKIFERLKLDLRYELTTQTNKVLAGLIFKYQKNYYIGKWNSKFL